MQSDPAAKSLFGTDLALIRREFGGNRLSYLLQLARAVDRAFSRSDYREASPKGNESCLNISA